MPNCWRKRPEFFFEPSQSLSAADDVVRVAVEVVAPVEGFTSYDGAGSDLPMQPFAFGYAITCHKAHGSQWGSVLVFDESKVFRRHRWRWLYTAITRAEERVVVAL